MTPISRHDAAVVGLARFFTGKPCKNDHLSERYVTTGACIACLREHSARYRVGGPIRAATVPSVRLATYVHPADAETVYKLIDYLNLKRGLPTAQRPVSKEGTPWEVYVRSWLRRPVTNRPSMADVRASAISRGIKPDDYSPGAQPFEDWTIPTARPNWMAAVDPNEGYLPDERK